MSYGVNLPEMQSDKLVTEQEEKVYLAEDIQRILRIGRSKTYQFLEEAYMENKFFRVIKVGKLFRVPKDSFDNWLSGV